MCSNRRSRRSGLGGRGRSLLWGLRYSKESKKTGIGPNPASSVFFIAVPSGILETPAAQFFIAVPSDLFSIPPLGASEAVLRSP